MTSALRPSPPGGVRSGLDPRGLPPADLGTDAPADPWATLTVPPRARRAAWAVLVTAARRVVAAHPAVATARTTAAEVEPRIVRLVAAAGEALHRRTPVITDSQALVPLGPLLDAIRSEVLADADGLAESGELLPLLRALERVREALAADDAQRLAARLGDGDAMNLVVEVAHDMRSPLSSILFLVERLRRGQSGPVNAVQERQLGLMYSAAFGLATLASDVMELARGGDRLVSSSPIAFSVAEILGAVRDVVQPMAEEKGLALVLEPPTGDWRVGYPQALNRVLLNLTTNALKFTNEGQVRVAVTATAKGRVEFVVEDTGRGIPPHVIATLFDAFRRRNAPGDYAFSSAGLGLSICRKLILAMGSELQVETELERGTRFRFELELPAAPRF